MLGIKQALEQLRQNPDDLYQMLGPDIEIRFSQDGKHIVTARNSEVEEPWRSEEWQKVIRDGGIHAGIVNI